MPLLRRAFDLSKELPRPPVRPAAAALAMRCSRRDMQIGRRAARREGGRRRATADRRRLAGPIPRAAHPLLARGGQTRGSRARSRGSRACADAVGLPMAAAMAGLAEAALDLDAGDAGPRRRAGLRGRGVLEEVGERFEAAMAGARRRALAEAGEHDRAAAEIERAAAAFESFGSTRYRDEAERESASSAVPSTPLGAREGERNRCGTLTERELQVGPTRRRPQDQPRDRRRAVPQPEDRREPHPKHVPQARRRTARGGRARHRARRPQGDVQRRGRGHRAVDSAEGLAVERDGSTRKCARRWTRSALPRPNRRGRRHGTPPARTQPPRRRTAAPRFALAVPRRDGARTREPRIRPPQSRPCACRTRGRAGEAAESLRAGCTRRSSSTTASNLRSTPSPHGSTIPVELDVDIDGGDWPARSRQRPTTSSRRHSPTFGSSAHATQATVNVTAARRRDRARGRRRRGSAART